MAKFLATLAKELLLLIRDRSGLLILFAMPAALVVVFTLIQNNILKSSEALEVEVLWVDEDRQASTAKIAERLRAGGSLTLVTELEGEPIDPDRANRAVAAGHFPAAVWVPKGLSASLNDRMQTQMGAAQAGQPPPPPAPPPAITLMFDPLAQGALRSAVTHALNGAILALEMELKSQALSTVLPGVDPTLMGQRFVEIDDRRLVPPGLNQLPTAVQQNVPAWALFGMFFIVVPLSGTLIKERRQGTLLRLRSLPVSRGTLLAGKVAAYVIIAGLQFILILAVGKFLLPALGTPPLVVGNAPLAMAVTVISAALAAAGYGILLWTLVSSYEQASMFGAVSVVIAAALGGIMVPVYVMPATMQQISQFSPLSWGLKALLKIFVRGDTLVDLLPEIGALLAFGIGCTLLSGLAFKLSRDKG